MGDLLTVQREQNVQGNLQDSTNTSDRLVGLISALANFHTYGSFMEVFHTFLLSGVILIYYYGNNTMREIDMI